MDVNEAQRQINLILRQLEQDTGSVVKSIELQRLEVTCYGDPSPRFSVTSVVELERLPSQQWNV